MNPDVIYPCSVTILKQKQIRWRIKFATGRTALFPESDKRGI
ncbi:hypothetical protein [Moorena sp. SIOASIH]|nr:hypothetical protein [Moorena sp. SIOASIH]